MAKPETAEQIAARIKRNVADLDAGTIGFAEFSRRQYTAWDLVIGRPRVHARVLDILHGRV